MIAERTRIQDANADGTDDLTLRIAMRGPAETASPLRSHLHGFSLHHRAAGFDGPVDPPADLNGAPNLATAGAFPGRSRSAEPKRQRSPDRKPSMRTWMRLAPSATPLTWERLRAPRLSYPRIQPSGARPPVSRLRRRGGRSKRLSCPAPTRHAKPMTVIAPPAAEPLDDEYDALLGRLARRSGTASLRAGLVPSRTGPPRTRARGGGGAAAGGGRRARLAPGFRTDRRRCARPRRGGAAALPQRQPLRGEQLAVVATGGYGRGTLAPCSDIDLLFLLPYKQTPWGESVVEAMLYVLWDLGLKVGHATRTVDECIRQAPRRHDHPHRDPRGALPDRRRARCSTSCVPRFDKEIVVKGTAPEFVAAKLAERDERDRAGRAPRATWSSPTSRTARAACATSTRCSGSPSTSTACATPSELVDGRLVHARGVRALPRAARNSCGRCAATCTSSTGRAEERLTFDLQRADRRPARLRRRARGLLGGRALHEALFPRRQGRRRPDRASSAPRSRSATPSRAPMLDRLVGRLRRAPRGRIEDATISSSTTTASTSRDDEVFERDPVNLIRLFWLADKPQPRRSTRRDAAGHALAEADRPRRCATTRRPTGCSSRS